MTKKTTTIDIIEKETIVIRFAGDSGDGIQISGAQFTDTSACLGNDVHTFPDFPAEIRAPSGTLTGVSGFQISFSAKELHTQGDFLQALIAFNPAALKTNIQDLEENGLLIVNEDSFTEKNFKKAKYADNPLLSGELAKYRVLSFPFTTLTLNAVKSMALTHSQAVKCKNMFALGLVYWLYTRPIDTTLSWIEKKFSAQYPVLSQANQAALKAGYNYGMTIGAFSERYLVNKALLPKGTYRQITGNEAFALACVAVALKSHCPFVLSGYPITPASSILQIVAKYAQNIPNMQVFQAEDEIAAMSATVGASFGGGMALTVTSGPGFDLKSEALGLAVMTELPCVIIDVQRAGPSTGMPTKTEQADLLMAMYGRHGESPVPILSPQSPSDCFTMLIVAFQLAVKYMTPVIILSDAYLSASAEAWCIPSAETLPDLRPVFHQQQQDKHTRHPITMAKKWIIPGTKDLEYCLGGLEKNPANHISYDPDNHAQMVSIRAQKIQNIIQDVPDCVIYGQDSGKLLIISWGSTYGAVFTALDALHAQGYTQVSAINLRYLNPLPKNLLSLINNFEHLLVPELNSGQLSCLLRAKFLVNAISITKITGKPFSVSELYEKFLAFLR